MQYLKYSYRINSITKLKDHARISTVITRLKLEQLQFEHASLQADKIKILQPAGQSTRRHTLHNKEV